MVNWMLSWLWRMIRLRRVQATLVDWCWNQRKGYMTNMCCFLTSIVFTRLLYRLAADCFVFSSLGLMFPFDFYTTGIMINFRNIIYVSRLCHDQKTEFLVYLRARHLEFFQRYIRVFRIVLVIAPFSSSILICSLSFS